MQKIKIRQTELEKVHPVAVTRSVHQSNTRASVKEMDEKVVIVSDRSELETTCVCLYSIFSEGR